MVRTPYARLRKHLQLRPAHFAQALDIDRSRVWQLEHRGGSLSPEKIRRIFELWPEATQKLGLSEFDFVGVPLTGTSGEDVQADAESEGSTGASSA